MLHVGLQTPKDGIWEKKDSLWQAAQLGFGIATDSEAGSYDGMPRIC
jgi:hypothetical protein